MATPTRPALLRNLQIGFGLSLLILIVTSIASFSSINNLLDGSRLVDHTDSVINELTGTLTTLTDAETGQRGYLLTGDTAFLRPYNGANDRALSLIDMGLVVTVNWINPLPLPPIVPPVIVSQFADACASAVH